MSIYSSLTSAGDGFLANGGGITGDLFRSIDWSTHPLGPTNHWPTALKTTLNILFHSQHPMFIWWGPELYQFYNDAYKPSFGAGREEERKQTELAGCNGHRTKPLDQKVLLETILELTRKQS